MLGPSDSRDPSVEAQLEVGVSFQILNGREKLRVIAFDL